MMSSVRIATCCTPGPPKNSRYSSIWLFFLPGAGSLMGNFTRPSPLAITLDISAVKSVEMSLSSNEMMLVNPRMSSYHFIHTFILPSSTLPTMWSTSTTPTGSPGSLRVWKWGRKCPLNLSRLMNVWRVSPYVQIEAMRTDPLSSSSVNGSRAILAPRPTVVWNDQSTSSTSNAMSCTKSPWYAILPAMG